MVNLFKIGVTMGMNCISQNLICYKLLQKSNYFKTELS